MRRQVLQVNGGLNEDTGTGDGTRSTIHGGSRVALLLMGVHTDLRCTDATTGHATKNVHSRI